MKRWDGHILLTGCALNFPDGSGETPGVLSSSWEYGDSAAGEWAGDTHNNTLTSYEIRLSKSVCRLNILPAHSLSALRVYSL